MPEYITDGPNFDVLDADRTHAHDECGRGIFDSFGYVEPYVAEIDSWLSMPVRLAHSALAGWHIEIGPYDLDAADIGVLQRAIAAYHEAAHGNRLRIVKGGELT